jgi:hypothetical protein
MRKLLPFLVLLLALSSFAPASILVVSPSRSLAARPNAAVYVCMSKSSVAYHSRDNCAGLNRCTHEVKSMSVGTAEEIGKRACMKCY